MDPSSKIWLDGEILKYSDAKVPILTHSLQYGSGIFEGIRSYKGENGTTGIFRLDEHIDRFFHTASIYSMKLGYSKEELKKAIVDILKDNNLEDSYIRPFAFYNDDSIGMATKNKKISVFIGAMPFGAYFANKMEGIRCKVSSWNRINSTILPVQAKASGNYINSIIASNEAYNLGYDEAIMISNGYVSEGPGENIFMIKNNELITPAPSDDILLGITRDTIIKFAPSLGYKVIERRISRAELYLADEVFFAGTAAEITPIIEVDNIKIGNGEVGEITKKIAEKYNDIVRGKNSSYLNSITYIN